MSGTYEKGYCYVTDVDGFDPINTHMPTDTFINCDDGEVNNHITDEELQKLLPYGCGEMECIYMLKTVTIKMTVKVIVK